MDFNYYLHRLQVSRLHAENAACEAARRSHQMMAEAYARIIEHEQGRRGASTPLVRAE